MTRASPNLASLQKAGVFADIDVELAQTLARIGGDDEPEVKLAVALSSLALRNGQVCLRLRRIDPWMSSISGGDVEVAWPDADAWIETLRRSPLVAREGEEEARPLVLTPAGDLYFARAHTAETELAKRLRQRAAAAWEHDARSLRGILDALFGEPDRPDSQRAAAAIACTRPLLVVTGGPGTGKTTTVLNILAALQRVRLDADKKPLRIGLMAPTGKAAKRMGETIAERIESIDERVRKHIPTEAQTIHRALRVIPGRPSAILYDEDRPLPFDVVVVDESSMIDLALMDRLVRAVRNDARLILLGDRHQLASIEAGAVLGDLCRDGDPLGPYGSAAQALLDRVAPGVGGGSSPHGGDPSPPSIRDCIVELEKSHRFAEDSGIARFASAVRKGDADAALDALARGGQDIAWLRRPGELSDPARTVGALEAKIDAFLGAPAADPSRALSALKGFRILCAHRRGPLGSETLNDRLSAHLAAGGFRRGLAFDHQPILIRANDYSLGLFNGDIGVALRSTDGTRVFFETGAGEPRSFHPSRLPAHETAYAMTVHKSQGSEFDEVLLVLPERQSAILTRELIYTGATRARTRLVVAATEDALRRGIARRIQRASGLRRRLWNDAQSPPDPPTVRRQKTLF